MEPLNGIEINYLRARPEDGVPAHWLIEAYQDGKLLEDQAAPGPAAALTYASKLAAKYSLPINR